MLVKRADLGGQRREVEGLCSLTHSWRDSGKEGRSLAPVEIGGPTKKIADADAHPCRRPSMLICSWAPRMIARDLT